MAAVVVAATKRAPPPPPATKPKPKPAPAPQPVYVEAMYDFAAQVRKLVGVATGTDTDSGGWGSRLQDWRHDRDRYAYG